MENPVIPSECLEGLSIENGWKVIEKITKNPNGTGGYFSAGYKVIKESKTAFLKAFDFHRALQTADPLNELKSQLDCYLFEKELLDLCKSKHMHKVVLPIDSGKVDVPGFAPLIGTVYYIIFELAEGDIRTVYNIKNNNFEFIFTSLHNIAVGIKELHTNGIAHQDIKPSNALVFQNEIKISDIGRASCKTKPFKYDNMISAGDCHYIAPEQNYYTRSDTSFEAKYAADMYAFGSLFYFYLFNISLSSIFQNEFTNKGIILSMYLKDDLELWNRVFADILIQTENELKTRIKKENVLIIIKMIKELCNPDPKKRGHSKNVATGIQQYSLERFISQLDILSKKAKYNTL